MGMGNSVGWECRYLVGVTYGCFQSDREYVSKKRWCQEKTMKVCNKHNLHYGKRCLVCLAIERTEYG